MHSANLTPCVASQSKTRIPTNGTIQWKDKTMGGNQQKMREALDAAMRFIGNLEIEPYSPLDEDASELRQKIMDALSAPPRQCDIGTVDEQNARYEHYCFIHRTMERCCQDCPIKDEPCCELAWAQTPYAEEGDGDGE